MKYMVYWSVRVEAETPREAAATAHRIAKHNADVIGFELHVVPDEYNRFGKSNVGEIVWLKPEEIEHA